MSNIHTQALQYIQNTNGNATLENFYDDHEPIGIALWNRLSSQRLVYLDSSQMVRLTKGGEESLSRPSSIASA